PRGERVYGAPPPAHLAAPPAVMWSRVRGGAPPPGYQRLLCTGCGSTDFEARLSAGEGVICVHRNVSADADRWPVQMGEGFVVRCSVVGPREAIRPGARVRLVPGSGGGAEPVVELCDLPVPHYWG
ncbi:hypothetical protein ACFV0G_35235, partial [Kitasatospora sp. NPDC059571]